ncbi:SDR family NAD(P)-dependent oxidoreductase [Terrarubrum flagellatum]|uniref:SDR family NAD(P)-dependent oxidoreductase n=1 Tax=Terrirubrum flagellatum TaxID=2895980 RepID=UPI0031456BC3
MTGFAEQFPNALKAKIALVTGAGAGIGRAIAECFAACGATVIGAEKDEARVQSFAESLRKSGDGHLARCIDVTDANQIATIMKEIEDRFGRLDLLVNNVGDVLGWQKAFADTKPEEWDALYAVNLRHIFLATHAALPLLRRGMNAGIISVSTIEAFRGVPMFAVYGAFKTAISGFTRSLALELAPENIRVNAIAPETTETEQIKISSWIPEEYQDFVKRWIPLGRYGRPDDCAGAALFLASDLSSWITGATINVDGGALAAGGWRQTRDGVWTNRPVITAHAHK